MLKPVWSFLRVAAVSAAALCLFVACEADSGKGADCKVGCEHIQACRLAGYDDSDLQEDPMFASQEACEAACAEYASDDDAACAARTTDCADLDDICDTY